MAQHYKALIFDLGGVLLNWDASGVNAISSSQLRLLLHSDVWHSLDRGKISLEDACKVSSHRPTIVTLS